MSKKTIIGISIIAALAIGGGLWYYYSQIHHTGIEKILSNPREFAGNVVIEGEVTDRTAFFNVLKFFKVNDKTGEIIVVTKKTLPEMRSVVRVKGTIDDSFSIGDQKLLVFVEASIEKRGKNKQ